MKYLYKPEDAGAVFVDGVATGLMRGYTPDISWRTHLAALRERRPELHIEHLHQPCDWRDILSGKAPPYDELIESMARYGSHGLRDNIHFIAVFGFSLGGLSALRVAHALSGIERDQLQYVALVTLGTPFIGTGRILDRLLRRVRIDYLQSMLNQEENQELFEELVTRTRGIQLRILLGEIERDEFVSPSSALAPEQWLSDLPAREGLEWGTFKIPSSRFLRSHDGLLHDPIALAYIDGLLDSLLPQ